MGDEGEVRGDAECTDEDTEDVCVAGTLDDCVAAHEEFVGAGGFEAVGFCGWVVGVDL